MKFLVEAQQVINYDFEVEADNLDEVEKFLKNTSIDHDSCCYGADSLVVNLPTVTYWEKPDYILIKEIE